MVSAIFASKASKNTKEITARVTLVKTCQSAALVARDGSIDWLCLPRFDSGACFAALLGTPEQRRWLIAPAREVQRTARRYRGHTLVLETEFHNADGVVALIDFMAPRSGQADVVRIVEGRAGRVPMRMDLVIRSTTARSSHGCARSSEASARSPGPTPSTCAPQ